MPNKDLFLRLYLPFTQSYKTLKFDPNITVEDCIPQIIEQLKRKFIPVEDNPKAYGLWMPKIQNEDDPDTDGPGEWLNPFSPLYSINTENSVYSSIHSFPLDAPL